MSLTKKKKSLTAQIPSFRSLKGMEDASLLCREVPETGCRIARILLTWSKGVQRKEVDVECGKKPQLKVS